jgi:predicted DNA-binding ribbon-helix-helix protein
VTGLIKRSFSLAGHRTSVALEDAFWVVLTEMAVDREETISALVAAIDAGRTPDQPLASALRVAGLAWLRTQSVINAPMRQNSDKDKN